MITEVSGPWKRDKREGSETCSKKLKMMKETNVASSCFQKCTNFQLPGLFRKNVFSENEMKICSHCTEFYGDKIIHLQIEKEIVGAILWVELRSIYQKIP